MRPWLWLASDRTPGSHSPAKTQPFSLQPQFDSLNKLKINGWRDNDWRSTKQLGRSWLGWELPLQGRECWGLQGHLQPLEERRRAELRLPAQPLPLFIFS